MQKFRNRIFLLIFCVLLIPSATRARYLNPNTGRFWSMDTYQGDNEESLSLHKYLYAENNPVNGIDPSGHDDDLGSLMISESIGASLDATYNGVVTTTGNAAQNQILYGGNAGIYTILLDAGFMVGGQVLMKIVGGGEAEVSQVASGFVVKQGLSDFQYAGEFGVLPVNMLKKLRSAGQVPAGTEIHHLIEQRFAKTLQIAPDDIPGIVLTPAEHKIFTDAWRKAIGYNNQNIQLITKTATKDGIWNAAKSIYANYPVLLEYCRKFLGK